MKIECTECGISYQASGTEGILWLKRIIKNDKCDDGKKHKWIVSTETGGVVDE